MKEKRRLTYALSARFAPSFTEQIPMRRDHPSHPLLNASWRCLMFWAVRGTSA